MPGLVWTLQIFHPRNFRFQETCSPEYRHGWGSEHTQTHSCMEARGTPLITSLFDCGQHELELVFFSAVCQSRAPFCSFQGDWAPYQCRSSAGFLQGPSQQLPEWQGHFMECWCSRCWKQSTFSYWIQQREHVFLSLFLFFFFWTEMQTRVCYSLYKLTYIPSHQSNLSIPIFLLRYSLELQCCVPFRCTAWRLFFRLFSHVGYYKILSIVLCAI